MIVEIKPTEDDSQFTVNGKTVRTDMDGIWKEKDELTPTESHFFREYLNTLTETNCRGLTATYTT